jgi:4-alpha-glucanotransferase
VNPRSSGILLHLTSLSNAYPIGDLGPAATAFVDFLVESGQHWWQMLPIGPTGEDDSPYQSSSAFAGNPLLIGLDRLVEQGILDRKEIELPISLPEGRVDYPAAIRLKSRCLRLAFEHFETDRMSDRQSELDAFARSQSYWLADFSLFLAIQSSVGTSNWTRWSQELRTRQPQAIARAQERFAGEIRFHQFVQWQFFLQWQELKAYCAAKRIGLIGDVPIFVAHQSADVWAHPELFKLDGDGNPTVVAGVPPDYFSKTGQLWGVPVYCWEALQRQNYSWWIERLRTAFARFDLNRLDHFIGFVRTYEVPAQDQTALNGQYQPGGGEAFFAAVRAALGGLPVIADDLGATTPEVTALMCRLQIPGMRVLQFEFGSNFEANSVPVNSVVYTGTHDNDTTAGWYQKLPEMQRQALQERMHANDQEVVWALLGEALASPSGIAIAPAQDLLELGSEARMNSPGSAKGNWRWRLGSDSLTPNLAQRLRKITGANRRLAEVPTPAAIATRAYALYEGRGRHDGQTVQDWTGAERETMAEANR